MNLRCPDLNCSSALLPGSKNGLIVRYGSFYRASDARRIRRFLCKTCGKTFSHSTHKRSKNQKRRRISHPLRLLLTSGVSQRRAALILRVNRKTIVRRFRYLANEERLNQETWLRKTYSSNPLKLIQFDDLETSEHTKCKPLSVALAVDPKTRKILNFKVSQMPAKGLLVKTALKKYGFRKDERKKGWHQMMQELKHVVAEDAVFQSDDNPHYPPVLRAHFKDCTHETTLGGRGSLTGQGELKKLRFDPLFSLNHTCAMLRANLNRLFRKTWCTTKNKQGLIDHISLYVGFHNQRLTPDVELDLTPTALGAS